MNPYLEQILRPEVTRATNETVFSGSRPSTGVVAVLALVMASGSISRLCAQGSVEISWGTSAIPQKIITSDGSAVAISQFQVELGGFDSGFTPTAFNAGEWMTHWRVFDAITENDTDTNGPEGTSGDGYVSGSGTDARFVGVSHLIDDGTSGSEDYSTGLFTTGQQAYVFIRDSDSLETPAEWLLYTSNSGMAWEYPAVTGGQTQLPTPWYVSDADTAILGAVNGSIVGGGAFTDGSSDFILRTHAIPEPSMALMLLGAVATGMRRRRRRMAPSRIE